MTTMNREDRRKAAKKGKSAKDSTEGVSSVESFKKAKSPIVTLPSGNRVKMIRPGMAKFLEAGFLPDPLAEAVQKMIGQRTGKAQDIEQIKQAADGDPEAVIMMLRVTDRVAAHCVTQPTVLWHERTLEEDGKTIFEEIPDEERDPEVVYTDEMEMEDKMFIFQLAVGGSSDLNQFRKSTRALMGDLLPGGEVVEATE